MFTFLVDVTKEMELSLHMHFLNPDLVSQVIKIFFLASGDFWLRLMITSRFCQLLVADEGDQILILSDCQTARCISAQECADQTEDQLTSLGLFSQT